MNNVELKSFENIETINQNNQADLYYQPQIMEFEQRIKSCISTVQLYEFEK